MTDQRLAEVLMQAKRLEAETEALMKTDDLAERDAAIIVLRLARPLRQKLETWVSTRALRAQLTRVS